MKAEIRNRPSFANVLVQLQPGDLITAEADAMASMSSHVQIGTCWNGGFFAAVLRRLFGGESLFVNEFRADSPAELVLTQATPGDIECLELNGTSFYLQPGAFLACERGVQLGLQWAGFSSLFGGEGLFRLAVSGTGKVWFSAYGGIFSREVTDEYIVDSGHLVGYEPTVAIRVGLPGGIFSSFFSGEGVVMKLRGPGRVYLQSRNFGGLTGWINSHL